MTNQRQQFFQHMIFHLSSCYTLLLYLSVCVLTVLCVSPCMVSAESSIGKVSELIVETTYKPKFECEKKSQNGSRMTVHYTGWYSNGTKFATSEDSKKPISFTIGAGHVIKGWDENLMNMCIGEKRKLTIPPHLGYGETGMDPLIPPNATLIFDVELVEIDAKPKVKYVFKEIDLDGDGRLSQKEVQAYLLSMASELGEAADAMETKDSRQKMLDMIMSSHDKDKDGFLTEEEFYKNSKPPPHDEL